MARAGTGGGWTRVERRILDILQDGRPHTRAELRTALWDPEGALSNIQPHISAIRKRLRIVGQEIVCEIVCRRICYRWVTLLSQPAVDGRGRVAE